MSTAAEANTDYCFGKTSLLSLLSLVKLDSYGLGLAAFFNGKKPKAFAVRAAAEGVFSPGEGPQANAVKAPRLGKAAARAADLPTWGSLFWIHNPIKVTPEFLVPG